MYDALPTSIKIINCNNIFRIADGLDCLKIFVPNLAEKYREKNFVKFVLKLLLIRFSFCFYFLFYLKFYLQKFY